MDILSPTNSVSEVDALHQAGATELYCGLMRPETAKKYTNVFSLNSRHVSEANLSDFGMLREIVAEAHLRGMKVYVTYNAIVPAGQFEELVAELPRTIECGVDALIVADIALMKHLGKHFPDTQIIASTLGGAFNSLTCELYRSLGATRITLPRPLTIEEIKNTTAAVPDMEFEIFVMAERCYFPNALCNFEHATYRVKKGPAAVAAEVAKKLLGPKMNVLTGSYNPILNYVQDRFVASNGMMCCREYDAELMDAAGGVIESGLTFRFIDIWNNFREACGLCALYDIAPIPNVCSVKLVGRQSPTQRKCDETRMVRDTLALLENRPDRDTFVKAAKNIRTKVYPGYCGDSFCYYNSPEKLRSNKKDGDE